MAVSLPPYFLPLRTEFNGDHNADAYFYAVVAYGMGRHASTLSLDHLSIVLQHLLAFECLYVTAVATVKLSILAMYLRIFPSRGFKLASWAIGGTIVAWCIAIVLVCIFQCDPIRVAVGSPQSVDPARCIMRESP